MLQTIINLVSGLAGGNIAGASSKQNPGIIINSIAGLAGGGLGGALINSLMNSGGKTDAAGIVGGIISSVAGGVILAAIAGLIKSRMTVK